MIISLNNYILHYFFDFLLYKVGVEALQEEISINNLFVVFSPNKEEPPTDFFLMHWSQLLIQLTKHIVVCAKLVLHVVTHLMTSCGNVQAIKSLFVLTQTNRKPQTDCKYVPDLVPIFSMCIYWVIPRSIFANIQTSLVKWLSDMILLLIEK